MDRNSFLGGSPLAVVIRLALISLVVGIVMSALGISPANLLHHLEFLVRRLYDMGFGAFEWIGRYIVVGAVVVVPIWLIVRVFSARGRGTRDT